MNNSQILQKDFKSLCRTCMSSDSNLTSLFAVLSLSNKDEALNSILFKCTSIQVLENDVLPLNICSSCLEKLAICYLYRELCYETQSRLQQLYESRKQLLPYIVIENNQHESYKIVESVSSVETQNIVTDSVKSNSKHIDPSSKVENIEDTETKLVNLDEKQNYESCDFEQFGCDKQILSETDESNSEIKEENVSCHLCPKTFTLKYSLNRHLKTHSNCEELKCTICLKKFSRAADVRRHMSTHTGEKPHSCPICSCSFTQSGTLASHLRKHKDFKNLKFVKKRGKEQHLCPICGKSFRHSSTLTVHLRRHVGDKPYSCDVCKLRFVAGGHLRSHMRVHSGERPYTCNVCNKTFAQSSAVSRHLKSHSELKPHKCSFCSKQFTTPYYLNIHMRQHTGEKPLKCSTCNKTFADPKNLKQHQKIHSKEKPYLCIVCGKSFRRSHHLKTHMKIHDKAG